MNSSMEIRQVLFVVTLLGMQALKVRSQKVQLAALQMQNLSVSQYLATTEGHLM